MSQLFEWCKDMEHGIASEAAIMADFSKVLGEIGVHHISYIEVSLSGGSRASTTYPESWHQTYLENALYRQDPAIRVARNATGLQLWDVDTLEGEDRAFFEQSRAHGVPHCGCAMYLYQPGSVSFGVFSLASDLPAPEWRALCRAHRRELEVCGNTLRDILDRLGARAEEPKLSPREHDVLTWAARGKTSWETAAILGLTEGTVYQYIRSAMRKLGACSKLHCVILAIEAGVLEI